MIAVIAIAGVTTAFILGAVLVYQLGVREIERREREALAQLGLTYDWDAMSDEELDELEEAGVIEWISAEEYEEALAQKPARRGLGALLTRERPKPYDEPLKAVNDAPMASDDGSKREVVRPTGESVYIAMDDPQFSVGETVVTVNPFTRQFVYDDYDGTPLYFEILDVLIDEEDMTYRYLISGEETWVAEEWLKTPGVSMMVKDEISGTIKAEAEASVKRGVELAEAAEAHLRRHTIDTYLDMMNSEDEVIRTQGKALLEVYQARIMNGAETNA